MSLLPRLLKSREKQRRVGKGLERQKNTTQEKGQSSPKSEENVVDRAREEKYN